MNKRLLFFVLGLALVCIFVLYAVAVWWPEYGGARIGPALIFDKLTPPGAFAPSPGAILVPPAERMARPTFWLRPFGLQRDGVQGIGWYVGSLVSWLALAGIGLFLAPRRVGVLARVLSGERGQLLLAFAIGVLGYLSLGLLAFLIFINVVGWPIMVILMLVVYLATSLGLLAVSLALGAGVCRLARLDDRRPLLHLFVGVLLLFLGSIIPYLGWAVVACSAALGFGAVLWTRGGSISGWSLDDSAL
jgi:hypothetical protein